MESVADAGPLIHLSQLDALHTLAVFDRVLIPAAVRSEAQAHGADLTRAPESTVFATQSLVNEDVHVFVGDHGLGHLQRGEIEGLLLCHQAGIRVLLTDDLAARTAAHRLGIVPVGSLGIVVRACHRGLVDTSEARSLLLALYDRTTLYVTRALVELAIERLPAAHE